jgi:hypothetical protein
LRLGTSVLLLASLLPSGRAVASETDTLTVSVSHAVVVYGEQVVVSAKVPPRLASAVVTVVAKPVGAPAPQAIGAFGPQRLEWQTRVRPRIRTSFTATAGNESSRAVTVNVRPRVTLTAGKSVFLARVVAGKPFVGRAVQLERHTRSGWEVVRSAVLRRNPISFRTELPTGTVKLRAFVPASRKEPGYLAGFSKPLVVRR